MEVLSKVRLQQARVLFRIDAFVINDDVLLVLSNVKKKKKKKVIIMILLLRNLEYLLD